ncbi:MAG TPA: hypothetical protein PK079_05145 [Leptospiraceae bacterium]|nr:hypothetical protein [Leptospiraceae bacterium]HMW06257.1 hypothetical protein [Leptospiraceae bacterium]HMX33182.1 hypothetical protein [Leptospiraceae bacterium]HMY31719.1 hypothetical protein [Leptospiraceae bacterium]HMZ64512.1 hypothetical protein [Leptospiraceae bacterium]
MKQSNLKSISRWILRIHGILLILLAFGNTFFSWNAMNSNLEGPFHFLFSNHAAEIGLLQAYLLMSLLGGVLIYGSLQSEFMIFDFLGIAAHLIPLVTLFVLKSTIIANMGQETILYSASIHCSFILVESFSILIQISTSKFIGVAA